MAIKNLQTLEVIEAMENFLDRKRPPEDIRGQVDVGYRIEGQSIIIFTVRPQFNNPKVKWEYPIAKATFVETKNLWKILWFRADQKWHGYEPNLHVKSVLEFTEVVEQDKYNCFWN